MNISDLKTLKDLYDWLETIPFSRTKKNFARDFSDGILAAELIKYFFPSLVDLHNYPPSNSLEQKKINWSVLNQKVLKKLDFPISDITISELASGSRRDATEYFLYTLREKIDLNMKRVIDKLKKKKESPGDTRKELADDVLKEPEVAATKFLGSHECCRERLESGSVAINTSEKTKTYYLGDSNMDMVPRELYDQKVQELLACEETIQVLKARIHRLENMLQLKNVTIDRQNQTLEKLKGSQVINSDIVLKNKLIQKNAKQHPAK